MLELGQIFEKKDYDFEIHMPADPEAVFLCKTRNASASYELLKEYEGKTVLEYGVSKKEEDDQKGLHKAIWMNSVVGWRGITDKGEQMAYSEEAKDAIFERYHNTLCEYILKQIKTQLSVESGIEKGN